MRSQSVLIPLQAHLGLISRPASPILFTCPDNRIPTAAIRTNTDLRLMAGIGRERTGGSRRGSRGELPFVKAAAGDRSAATDRPHLAACRT